MSVGGKPDRAVKAAQNKAQQPCLPCFLYITASHDKVMYVMKTTSEFVAAAQHFIVSHSCAVFLV